MKKEIIDIAISKIIKSNAWGNDDIMTSILHDVISDFFDEHERAGKFYELLLNLVVILAI
jgi:hypothetical protein